MKLRSHIVATLTISSIIYLVYNSFSAFISSLIGGLLIDLDHLLDYYLHKGVNLKVGYFFNWCHECHWERLILFLHSIELMFILWIIISVFNLGIFWIGFAAGISHHLILDIFYNSRRLNLKILFYFFVYRLSKGFRKEYIIWNNLGAE